MLDSRFSTDAPEPAATEGWAEHAGGVSIPPPTEAAPLVTDEDVLQRVTSLVDRAYRRQIWFLFVDGEHRQLPVLPIMDVPVRPRGPGKGNLTDFLSAVMREMGAEELIVVYERSGRPQLTAADREWLDLVIAACTANAIRLRGPLLAHTHGIRWIASEDLG